MNQSVIIFDGACNFCNASINFIIQRDHAAHFKFATTQSKHGTAFLNDLGIDPKDPTTFVLIERQEVYLRSDAALEIAKHLRRPWSYFTWLKLVPKTLRDFVYTIIAKHRYKISGKRQCCMVPNPELRGRFLD